MKLDKLQIRLIIGIIFVLMMYCIISFLEPKNKPNTVNMHNLSAIEYENANKQNYGNIFNIEN